MRNWTYGEFIIHEFETVESTNSTAFFGAENKNFVHGEVIFAHQQIAGRGRMDRSWSSPQGNLYFSLILQPKISAKQISQLSFVAIVALRVAVEKVVEKVSKKSVENKWPNDLLLDKKKLAGVLLESKISGQNCEFVIVGIGVNISSNPDNVIFPATNLEDVLKPDEMLKLFLDEFAKIYRIWLDFGFTKIRNLWLEKAFALEEKISVKLNSQKVEGIFEDMDDDGSLILNDEGISRKITAGDVGVIS